MKRIISILLVLLLVFTITGCQEQGSISANGTAGKLDPLTTEQKIRDFEGLYKVLEENYPFFDVNKRMNGVDWLANKDKYIEMIKNTKTDEEYLAVLGAILKDLHNGHTDVLDKDFYFYYQAGLKQISNMSAWKEEINKPKSVMRYSDQGNLKAEAKPAANQGNNYVRANNVSNRILIENKIAYLSIASLNIFNVKDDMNIIKPFLQSIKDYNALIIDIRRNGGGDSRYWSENLVPMLISSPISNNSYYVFRGGAFSEAFIKDKGLSDYSNLKPISEIQKEQLPNTPPELQSTFRYYVKSESTIHPKDSVEFKGKIYLLVDKGVYSSSEMFASFAKSTGFAILVGEKTGGDGIGHDPLLYSLPESGYVVRFPLDMGLTADGSCNEENKTVPDVQVNAEKNEDINKDAAIQYILGLYK